jgi:hypothetical protein
VTLTEPPLGSFSIAAQGHSVGDNPPGIDATDGQDGLIEIRW